MTGSVEEEGSSMIRFSFLTGLDDGIVFSVSLMGAPPSSLLENCVSTSFVVRALLRL